MSSQTQQYVEELVALSPWAAFFVALCWSRVCSSFGTIDGRPPTAVSPADLKL